VRALHGAVSAPLCHPPSSFTLVYQSPSTSSGPDAPLPLSVYSPVSPPGFLALGCVVVAHNVTAPDRASIICIRASAVQGAQVPSQCLWRTAGGEVREAVGGVNGGAGAGASVSGGVRRGPGGGLEAALGAGFAASFWQVHGSSHRYVFAMILCLCVFLPFS
jgi:hypothetical protein